MRAVVSVPPQHGKSQLLLHHLVRLIQEQPQLQSAYVGYGTEFARDQAVLAEVIAREASRSDSAGPPIPFQRQTMGSWATTSGGGVYWTGIGGPLTGRRVDGVLIVDDPYKGRLEAESEVHPEAGGSTGGTPSPSPGSTRAPARSWSRRGGPTPTSPGS